MKYASLCCDTVVVHPNNLENFCKPEGSYQYMCVCVSVGAEVCVSVKLRGSYANKAAALLTTERNHGRNKVTKQTADGTIPMCVTQLTEGCTYCFNVVKSSFKETVHTLKLHIPPRLTQQHLNSAERNLLLYIWIPLKIRETSKAQKMWKPEQYTHIYTNVHYIRYTFITNIIQKGFHHSAGNVL